MPCGNKKKFESPCGDSGYIKSDCVYVNIPNLGPIKTNDSLSVVIQKLYGLLTPCTEPIFISITPNKTVTLGDEVTIEINASGSDLQYQWFKNNVLIAGATSSTYSISSVSNSDLGSYHVVVSNNCGSFTSPSVSLTVQANFMFWYGWQSTQALPEDPSTLQFSGEVASFQDIIADYRTNAAPRYLFLVTEIGQPVYNFWEFSTLSSGGIDNGPGGTNTFFYVEDGGYRYYLTNFPTFNTDTQATFSI